jgi:hypothetical protein
MPFDAMAEMRAKYEVWVKRGRDKELQHSRRLGLRCSKSSQPRTRFCKRWPIITSISAKRTPSGARPRRRRATSTERSWHRGQPRAAPGATISLSRGPRCLAGVAAVSCGKPAGAPRLSANDHLAVHINPRALGKPAVMKTVAKRRPRLAGRRHLLDAHGHDHLAGAFEAGRSLEVTELLLDLCPGSTAASLIETGEHLMQRAE